MEQETGLKRPSWPEYFIEIAQIVSKRSTCLRRRYGAVIVKDNVIVSTGYNGSPRGEANCIDTGTCVRQELNVPKGERYELSRAVHAEMNAIINCDPARMKGATIYVAGFNSDGSIASGKPCLLCSRMITNARIARVIYLDESGLWEKELQKPRPGVNAETLATEFVNQLKTRYSEMDWRP